MPHFNTSTKHSVLDVSGKKRNIAKITDNIDIHVEFYSNVSIICSHRANWHSPATLTEVFPSFFLSYKANARVYLAKTGHGPHSS